MVKISKYFIYDGQTSPLHGEKYRVGLVSGVYSGDIPQISRLFIDAGYGRLIGGLSAGYLRDISEEALPTSH
ncbi:hypothetical protein [Chitinophaga sp.]|uniref:hypothetical protein n=1 Tax=Chitinophaga sp. TaxID=1869181 RepID=UPI0031DF587A